MWWTVDLLTEYSNRPDVLDDLCAVRTKIDSLSSKSTSKRLSVSSKRARYGADTSTNTSYQPVRRLSASERDELVHAYRAGAKVAELATLFGIHRETVGKHLQAKGIDTRDVGLSPEQIQQAAELYRQGWAIAPLAEKFQVSRYAISSRLLEAGVVMRARRGGRQSA